MSIGFLSDFGPDWSRAILLVLFEIRVLAGCWRFADADSRSAKRTSCPAGLTRWLAIDVGSPCKGSSDPLLYGNTDSTDSGVAPGDGGTNELEPTSQDRWMFKLLFVIGSEESPVRHSSYRQTRAGERIDAEDVVLVLDLRLTATSTRQRAQHRAYRLAMNSESRDELLNRTVFMNAGSSELLAICARTLSSRCARGPLIQQGIELLN